MGGVRDSEDTLPLRFAKGSFGKLTRRVVIHAFTRSNEWRGGARPTAFRIVKRKI